MSKNTSATSVAKKVSKKSDAPAATTPVVAATPAVAEKAPKKAAAAKRAATKAAKSGKSVTSDAPVSNTAPTASSSDDSDNLMDFEPFTWKKMELLKNARGDVLTSDMEWFGRWDESAKKVDTSDSQPADLEL